MSLQPLFVFRGLTYDSDSNPSEDGLNPRNPDANVDVAEQINFYQTRRGTQFISTSKSFLAAAYYATKRGTCNGQVVKISLQEILPALIFNVSDQRNAQEQGLEVGTSLFNFAVRHGEILIKGHVNAQAVVETFTLNCVGSECSLDDFVSTLSQTFLTCIAREAYGANIFYKEVATSCCHLGLHCGLSDGNLQPCTELPTNGLVCRKCLNDGVGAVEQRTAEPAILPPAPSTPQTRSMATSSSTDLTPPPPIRPQQLRSSQKWIRTATGKKFHIDRSCSGLRFAKRLIEVQSRPDDLEPCALCCQ